VSQASQSAPAAPPAPVAAPPTSTPGQVAPVAAGPPTTAAVAARTRDTPSRLRRLSLAVIVGSVFIGLLGALIFSYLAYSLHRAEADTAQLLRVQKIQTNLLTADATATNAFLVGGLEPVSQRATYDRAMAETGSLVAEAAQAQPADANALSALNQQVVAYATSIEQARANNRQGFPVGAQYLRNASAQLRTSALPILDNLVSQNATRASDEMDVWVGWVFVVVALLGLAAAIWAQVWLARRFRRRINPGLLATSVLLLICLVAGAIGIASLSSSVGQTRTGSFAAVNAAADARISGNNAKANESLTLIARGSGASFETAWAASAATVTNRLGRLPDAAGIPGQWQRYAAVHAAIRKLDDGGKWDAAVAMATGSGADSSNTAFNAFDAGLSSYLDGVSQATKASLAGQQPALVIAAILVLLSGLGAALLGRRGVAARLREYR
jgi:hypothetical protein